MSTVPVPKGRAVVEDGGSTVRVSLPPRRHLLAILFLLAWLGGWFFGERQALRQLLASPDPTRNWFLMFWLVGWSIGGVFAVATVLWMLVGRERIELRPDALLMRRSVLGIGRERSYDLASVQNLRAGPAMAEAVRSRWSVNSLDPARAMLGAIAFDYGAKTIRCGAALDEAEARQIVDLFKQRNAQLRRNEGSSRHAEPDQH